MPDTLPILEVHELSKRFPGVRALHQVSLDLLAGEVLALIGENGAGKSTTLKMITGYISPTAGNVHVDGINIIDDHLEIQKQIGYLPELNPLYAEMKVYDYFKTYQPT